MGAPVLTVVVPCYNEEEVLPVTAPLFKEELRHLISLGKIAESSRVLFVDDGSKDGTWQVISELAKQDALFTGIAQSRNRGHQNAVLAGLMEAKDACDITISIDCDGQDDVNAMEAMVDAYADGCDIVYGVRDNRDTDTFFKRATAQGFYKLLRGMGVEAVYNHADYRLVSSKALEAFSGFKEVNLFLRGLFPLVGYKSTCVYYRRTERMAGKSHYPLSKMVSLAVDGITSLSVKPIRLISILGCVVAVLSFIGIIWTLVSHFLGSTITGWASTVCILCFVGGVQMLSLGVVGEYIGKIYLEVKARPRYIIARRTGEDGPVCPQNGEGNRNDPDGT